jgi:hypothetical protein
MKWLVPLVVFFLALPCRAQLLPKASVPVADPAYSDALAKGLTDQQLIDCLKGPKTCALDSRYHNFHVIKKELAARKHPDLIIDAYNKADDVDRYILMQTLWLIDDPVVESFMRSIAFKHLRDGIDDGSTVFELDYLAHSCDLGALARLNRDVFKIYTVVGCSYLNGPVEDAWADAVEAFGRCNYVPAAQNLVRSLDSRCLSAGKAGRSLKQIFPGYCSNPATVEEEQRCYEKLLHPDPQTK